MDELVRKFRNQLNRRQYDDLDDTWLELVEAGVATDELLALAEVVVLEVTKQKAALLLSVLAESLKEKGRYGEQLRTLHRQAELHPRNPALVQDLVDCLKKVYSEVDVLEQLLHKSGLGFGQALKDALPVFDRYLSFLPGARVFEPDRGPGRVKKLDLLLDRVTVDFDMGAELSWDIAAASRVVRVASPDGYFARLQRNRQSLVELVESEPATVVAMYLRDTGRPVSVRDLQTGLAQLVSADAWAGFWARARKDLARNPHVVALTGPARLYQWSDDAVKVEEKRVETEQLKHEFSDVELARLKDAALDSAYEKLTSFAERKRFIERLPSARPADWDRVMARLFSLGKDSRARTMIERELSTRRSEFWRSFLESALTGYRQNPDTFLWLLEHAGRLGTATPKGLASRALDLLESSTHKSYWAKLRSALVGDDYAMVRAALAAMEEAEAGRMMARVKRIRMLEGYRADEIVQLVAAKFPNLDAGQDEEVIYSTVQGIEKAREELRHLASVEIPKSADEIARARAHGDLSENYEYKAAKEKQARLMQRATRLREELAKARAITVADVEADEVSIGCRVRMEDGAGGVHEYAILGPWDTDPEHGIISYQSPFGGLLLGKKPGESVDIDGRPFAITNIELGLPS